MRAMARDMNVSEKTIRNIVKTDLKMSSLKMRTRQHVTNLQKEKRLARAKIFLNKLKADRPTDTSEIIFSVEKLFTRQVRTREPSCVKVWAAILKTWKFTIIFVSPGEKVNTDAYIETILTPALQAAKKHFKDKPFIFQQGGAPSHTSKKTQKWCQDHFPGFWNKEVWPPSSPDLNLMDFCVWSLLEADACASFHVSVEALKSSLEKVLAKIPQETLRKAAEGFRGV